MMTSERLHCRFCGCFATRILTRAEDGEQVPVCDECVHPNHTPKWARHSEPAVGGLQRMETAK